MRRILIAGCGYVGLKAGTLLTQQGHDVFGLRRSWEEKPRGISPVTGDLLDPETLLNIPDDLDDVVITVSADGFSEERYRAVYLDGIGNLLAAVQQQPRDLRRIVFTSSTGVYGQTGGELVTEESISHPAGFSGQVMLEAERQVSNLTGCGVHLRLGGIYGPGRDRLLRQVVSGEIGIPDTPVFTNRIHRDDAAGAIVHVLSLAAPQEIYNVVDEEAAEYGSLIRWLAVELGLSEPGTISDGEVTRSRGGNKRVMATRLVASGFRYRYPTYREGYREMIAASNLRLT